MTNEFEIYEINNNDFFLFTGDNAIYSKIYKLDKLFSNHQNMLKHKK